MKSLVKMAAISTIVAAAGAANAGVTPVNTGGTFGGGAGGPSDGQSVVRIMNRILTGQNNTSGVAGNVGNQLTFAGGITAQRVQDFVGSSSVNAGSVLKLHQGFLGNSNTSTITDQVWQDGVVSFDARARYAGQNQYFGVRSGTFGGSGWTAPLTGGITSGSATGAILSITTGGSAQFIDPTPGNENVVKIGNSPFDFRWVRSQNANGSSAITSAADDNSNNLDQMITFEIFDNIPGQRRYILAFEDITGGGGDRDFNDLVVELVVSIPLPTGAAMGMAGLGLLAIRRRSAR